MVVSCYHCVIFDYGLSSIKATSRRFEDYYLLSFLLLCNASTFDEGNASHGLEKKKSIFIFSAKQYLSGYCPLNSPLNFTPRSFYLHFTTTIRSSI